MTEGLAAGSPGFQRYLEAKSNEIIREEVRAAELRAELDPLSEAEDGVDVLSEFRRPEAQKAFLRVSGEVKAREHAQSLAMKFENDFNPEVHDIDQWLDANTHGLFEALEGTPDMLEGYMPGMVQAKSTIRQMHRQQVVAAVKKEREDIFMSSVMPVIEGGDFEGLERRRESAQAYGITLAESAELTVRGLSVMAERGMVDEIENIIDSKRSNGLSLAADSKFADRVENIRQQAVRVENARLEELQDQLDAEEEERLNASVSGLIIRALQGDKTVQADMVPVLAQLDRSDATALVNFVTPVLNNEKAVEDPTQIGAIMDQITNGILTMPDLARLTAQVSMKNSTHRSLAAMITRRDAAGEGASALKDPVYTSMVSMLKKRIPLSDPVFGNIGPAPERQMNAVIEFQDFALNLSPDVEDRATALQEKARELGDKYGDTDDFVARLSDGEIQRVQDMTPEEQRQYKATKGLTTGQMIQILEAD